MTEMIVKRAGDVGGGADELRPLIVAFHVANVSLTAIKTARTSPVAAVTEPQVPRRSAGNQSLLTSKESKICAGLYWA